MTRVSLAKNIGTDNRLPLSEKERAFVEFFKKLDLLDIELLKEAAFLAKTEERCTAAHLAECLRTPLRTVWRRIGKLRRLNLLNDGNTLTDAVDSAEVR